MSKEFQTWKHYSKFRCFLIDITISDEIQNWFRFRSFDTIKLHSEQLRVKNSSLYRKSRLVVGYNSPNITLTLAIINLEAGFQFSKFE